MNPAGLPGGSRKNLESPFPAALNQLALDQAVRQEQIRMLYHSHAIMFVNIINACLAAYLLRSLLPVWIFAAWIGLFCIVILARFFDCQRYLRAPPRAELAATWGWRFAAGAAATGCLWGLMAAGIFLTPEPAVHAFIAFTIGGMMAGAVAGDSAFLPALFGFMLPASLPVTFAFFALGNAMSITMGLMVAIFTAILGFLGFHANNWIASISRREILHKALAADLENRNIEREEAERELHRSNAILKALTESSTEILRSLDFGRSIPKVLELIGRSMGVRCAHLYENKGAANFALSIHHMWNASGTAPIAGCRNLWQQNNDEAMLAVPAFLTQENVQSINIDEVSEPLHTLLDSCGVNSFLVAPVFASGSWWGAIGVGDDKVNRAWSTIEIEALRTVGELIGTAITHARNLAAIADAGRIVENSSTMLYRLDPEYPYKLKYVSGNTGCYGYAPNELLAEPDRYLELVHPDDRPFVLSNIAGIVSAKAKESSCDFRLRKPDGSYVWIANRMHPVRRKDQKVTALEGILADINDQKLAQIETARLAHTDLLTGLPNRMTFMEWLQQAFTAATQAGKPFAILCLDLDDFKDVNEILGHSLGDELLKTAADRISGVLREGDRIARVGGDEFAVLLDGMVDDAVVGSLAARIIGSIAAPHSIGGSELHVTASIGISIYRAGLTKPEDIMREADLALYEAKESGRDKYVFYSDDLDLAVRERVTLVEEMRAALDHGEFEVYYQPEIDVPSRQIVGMEALLRWNHPSRGLLGPGHFIALAEKTGLIGPIGQWVLTEACRQLRIWEKEGIAPPVLGVNLSAAQLAAPSDFSHDLMQQLGASGLAPEKIELELTESVLMQTSRGHGDMVNKLRALGVGIAIDDFGTGYSSLEYLLLYRVSRIKIAQQFVNGLPDDPGRAAIVRAAIGLAREFGIGVIAEGVETAAQLEFLAAAGCRQIQGFYFSPPLPAGEAARALRQGVLAPAAGRDAAGAALRENEAARGWSAPSHFPPIAGQTP